MKSWFIYHWVCSLVSKQLSKSDVSSWRMKLCPDTFIWCPNSPPPAFRLWVNAFRGVASPNPSNLHTWISTVDVLWTTLEWCRDILSRSFLREKIVSWQGAINDRITLSVKLNTFGYQTTRYSIERILTLHQSKFQFFSISGCLLYCWQSLQF